MQIITHSESQTKKLGEILASEFFGGETILLQGNLGAGKTVFAKGIAKGLKIKKPITSPTFILMKVYKVKNHKTIKNLVHVDCYRINSEKDIQGIGLEEYLNRSDSVCLIEWPEKIKKILPKNRIIEVRLD